MDPITVLPDTKLDPDGTVCQRLINLGLSTFREAAAYIQAMPYGYNTNKTNPFALLDEGQGTCTTKHGLLALCANELGIPVKKVLGVYLMTAKIVSGIDSILGSLPGIPAMHCFLSYDFYRVDLTEGNCNGKNCPIDSFVKIWLVEPMISADEQKRLYREYLNDFIIANKDRFNGLSTIAIEEKLNACVEKLGSNLACAVSSNIYS